MEFTELADYPLSAGVLTEWMPVVDGGADGWIPDERPLAYTHEAHCRHSLATAADPAGKAAWIGAVFEIHEHFSEAAVRRALRSWTVRHETFRTTVTEDRNGALTRLTVPEDDVNIASSSTGGVLAGSRIHDHLTEFFGHRLSPFRWPHCLVATVHNPGETTFLIVFGADHSVMDAYSMLLAVSELRRLYEYELRGTDPRLAEIGSHVDFSALDRQLGDSITEDHRAVRAWSEFLNADSEDGPEFPEFPLPVTGQSHTYGVPTRQSSLSSWLLGAEHTDMIAGLCRSRGHGLQSGILAALALTSRGITGAETLRFTMPMHTRYEPRYAQSVGWYVGVVPLHLDLAGALSFTDCLGAATDAVERTKGLARLPYSKIADILGVTSEPRFVVSYLDLRHTPDSADWARWHARTLRGSVESLDEVYFWILRTPLGLNVAARYPSHEQATANVHRFVGALKSELKALADISDPAKLREMAQ